MSEVLVCDSHVRLDRSLTHFGLTLTPQISWASSILLTSGRSIGCCISVICCCSRVIRSVTPIFDSLKLGQLTCRPCAPNVLTVAVFSVLPISGSTSRCKAVGYVFLNVISSHLVQGVLRTHRCIVIASRILQIRRMSQIISFIQTGLTPALVPWIPLLFPSPGLAWVPTPRS